MKLNFITKQTHRSRMDVSITLTGKNQQTNIVLRNGADRKITSTQHIAVAIAGERLYFREETPALGFKISAKGDNRAVKFANNEINDWTATHAGDYPLEYDKENCLYFIDTE